MEDGVSCYDFLINNLGYSAEQIAIAGDSAGGHLALITLLKLKETNKPLPSCLALLSPWTDPNGSGDTYTYEMAERDVLLGPMFKKIWDSGDKLYNFYLNDEDMDENNPYVVPYVGNYENCPPIMIQVGTEECLLSDSTRLRDKFTKEQALIYDVVLNAQEKAINFIKPGVTWNQVHAITVKEISLGLINLGIINGDIESIESKESIESIE